MGGFEVAQRRAMTAWMDLLDIDAQVPAHDMQEFFTNALTAASRAEVNAIVNADDWSHRRQQLRALAVDRLKENHGNQFPLSDNMTSRMFLVQADLNEQQRERFGDTGGRFHQPLL